MAKCVKKVVDGKPVVKRVSNAEAEEMIRSGWKYTNKDDYRRYAARA